MCYMRRYLMDKESQSNLSSETLENWLRLFWQSSGNEVPPVKDSQRWDEEPEVLNILGINSVTF